MKNSRVRLITVQFNSLRSASLPSLIVRRVYAAVQYRRPNLSGRRSSCLEQSAAACHGHNITVCLPQPPEDTSLYALLSLTVPAIVNNNNNNNNPICKAVECQKTSVALADRNSRAN